MKKVKTISRSAGIALLILFFMTTFKVNANPGDHPNYLRALSDLRAARWMLDHRPGNWVQTMDEMQAVKEIDKAIDEIRKASIDDGKDVNWHPAVDEHPDHPNRLRDADDFLRKARQDISKEEDNGFASGLRDRAYNHIDAAIGATERAMKAFPVVMAKPIEHPNYLQALSDLRAARWMLDHRPGNWVQTMDEMQGIQEIDKAIDEIKKASIDDGKDVNWHPAVDEHPDHPNRLRDADDFLRKARQDISKEEDNGFANGLRDRAFNHIDAAIGATERAMKAFPVVMAKPIEHPNYLQALSDLRAARWMLDHRPGNWEQTEDEMMAVKEIDNAVNEIKKASIDDGKDVNWHPAVDEHPDHRGRLRDADDFLRKARQDISKEEDNGFANGLRDRAFNHIDAAIGATERAMKQMR